MHTLFNWLNALVQGLFTTDRAVDPLDALSPREWADLPVYHPQRDDAVGC